MKKLVVIFMILVILLGIAACSSSRSDMAPAMPPRPEMAMYALDDAFELPLTGGGLRVRRSGNVWQSTSESAVAEPASANDMTMPRYEDLEWEDIAGTGQRHIIQTANVELDTEYFHEVVEELRQLAPAANGFVESDMLTARGWRRFTIVLRIPAQSFDTVLRQVEGLAYVRVSNQWAQDVTDQFYDIAGSYEIRRLEEERILALIEEAESVQELLALEQRLGNTRLSIEMYLSQLNHMAGQIAYSTISVTVLDVGEEPVVELIPSLGQRIGGAFGDSVDGTLNAAQNIIVFLAGAIIPLALLGLVGTVFLYAVRRRRLH
ncbi:MAG: DUF4349 domain-containing protein [Defluviitaleaceae bacterium]|nr:DUF4349 domain-containing protein [Defluviitaleaceae bacterium]